MAAPPVLLTRFPELHVLRLRRGGVPVRVASWVLGDRGAAAITLWRTIFVAHDATLEADLLLHELRHVHQFEANVTFPILYLWESLRRGYHANRFEADARTYASERLREAPPDSRSGDV